MNIKNCKSCGKIYNYDGFDICYHCRNKEEETFQKVREYIYDHKHADIKEVSKATDVPVKKILDFLRAGKLEIKEGSNMILDCERCGSSIKSGRFCNRCINEMERELKGAIKKEEVKKEKIKENNKFRIRN